MLIGLLYLALQIRTVFADQVKQEYAGLVLEAVERAETARARVGVWDQVPHAHDAAAEGYGQARAELTRRLASLAALVNASPANAPRIPSSVLLPDATFAEMDRLLGDASSYWHTQRDTYSADMRKRITGSRTCSSRWRRCFSACLSRRWACTPNATGSWPASRTNSSTRRCMIR